jgi:uncharacterized OB-fold protein
MGIDKFGVVNFTVETKAADFVAYLEQGKVMATQCRKCNKVYFPPRMDCSNCYSDQMEWIEITGTGRLITFSTIIIPPTGFEDNAPYTVAVAKFPSEVEIFGWITKNISSKDIKVGMALKVTPVRLPNDRVFYHFEEA